MIGAIAGGTLALIGVERGDTEKQAARLLERLLSYRIFPDDAGRMNLDLGQAGGSLLLVPQFTLAADTNRGNRAWNEARVDFLREEGSIRDVLEPLFIEHGDCFAQAKK